MGKENNQQLQVNNVNKKMRRSMKKKPKHHEEVSNTGIQSGDQATSITSKQHIGESNSATTTINEPMQIPKTIDQQINEGQQNLKLQDTEANIKTNTTFVVDPGEIHTNYLKLINGASLEEDKNSGKEYDGNQSDSSYEEEEDPAEDLDNFEESISEDSEEYASVINSEDLSDVRATAQTNKVNEIE
ncbi:hypothetical protein A4A49_56432 [Nicotiana attenuata]|nr:hypothetical protein A4A49_56432 [Nicotiana attenuata]